MKTKRPGRTKHIPQRTCIACRRKTDKRLLTRLVRTPDAGVVIDPSGKRNGRGAYLCHRTACWEKALNTELLNKALKTEISAETLTILKSHNPDQIFILEDQ